MAKGKSRKQKAKRKSENQAFSPNWADAHDDVLDLILEKLVCLPI